MTDQEAGRVRDFVGYGRTPPDPKWPGGAHVAVNFVINYEEGGEVSVPDGAPASETGLTEGATAAVRGRDLGAESMFEYGSRAGFWRLHRLFTKRGQAFTGFAIPRALARHPAACPAPSAGCLARFSPPREPGSATRRPAPPCARPPGMSRATATAGKSTAISRPT